MGQIVLIAFPAPVSHRAPVLARIAEARRPSILLMPSFEGIGLPERNVANNEGGEVGDAVLPFPESMDAARMGRHPLLSG